MKLADLNKNNIELGYGRTIEGDSFEFAVPMSFKQTRKSSIKVDDQPEQANTDDNDVEEIEKSVDKVANLISMANSWAPYRKVSNIKKAPNTANII